MKLNSINFSLWKIWIAVFIYSFIIAIFIQFIFLPYIVPSWSAGHGILKNTDGVVFHELAVELADTIRAKGWSAWQLRPSDQVPAGIASIFYVLIFPDPRIFIPISAALHASAALILIYFTSLLTKNKTKALLCALPFIVFPSNLQWTAQWHKDGFCILGVFLILCSIIFIATQRDYKVGKTLYVNFRAIFCSIIGMSLLYFVRPYLLTMFLPIIRVLFFILILFFLVKVFKKQLLLRTALFALLAMLLVLSILGYLNPHFNSGTLEENPLVQYDKEGLLEYVIEEVYEFPIAAKPAITEPQLEEIPVIAVEKEEAPVVMEAKQREQVRLTSLYPKEKIVEPITKQINAKPKKMIRNYDIENYWRKSSWVSTAIENKFYSLALFRRGFRIYPGNPKSSVDANIGFNSIKSVLTYLPRAIQIAFLAPFPNQWFAEGSSKANSFMRRVSALEMTVAYFALIFLPYTIWHWRKRIEIWMILLLCFYMMLIYGLIICNIGTLYRMRYPYLTILIALEFAGFFAFLERIAIRRKN